MRPKLRADALWRIAQFTTGDERNALLGEAMAAYEAAEDDAGVGWVLAQLAEDAFRSGKEDEAKSMFDTARELARQGGDEYGAAVILANYAGVLRRRGRLMDAYVALQECLEYHLSHRQVSNIAKIKTAIGSIARRTGQCNEAIALLRESLEYYHEIGDLYNSGQTICELAIAYAAAGMHDRAREQLAAARRLESGFTGAGSIGQLIAESEEECSVLRMRTQNIAPRAPTALEVKTLGK
jgi:tetratricopeptide (TPR) repeat protein